MPLFERPQTNPDKSTKESTLRRIFNWPVRLGEPITTTKPPHCLEVRSRIARCSSRLTSASSVYPFRAAWPISFWSVPVRLVARTWYSVLVATSGPFSIRMRSSPSPGSDLPPNARNAAFPTKPPRLVVTARCTTRKPASAASLSSRCKVPVFVVASNRY